MDSLEQALDEQDPDDFKSERKERKAKFDQGVETKMKDYERQALQTIPKGTSPDETKKMRQNKSYIPVDELREQAKKLGYKDKTTKRSTLLDYIKANDPNYEKRFYAKTPAPAKKKRQRGTGKTKISKKYM